MSIPYRHYFIIIAVVALTYYLFSRPPGVHDDSLFDQRDQYIIPADDIVSTGDAPHFQRKIVAIGDLHGDLPNALKVLKMTGVIDEDEQWTGDVGFLVQTGDIIDRGDDTIPLFELIEDLRVQAQEKGGVILSNLGNHEWMNAIGDWRYVYSSEIETFGGVAARQEALSTGWLGRAWAENYTVTTRLPLHPILGPPNTDYDSDHFTNTNNSIAHAALSFVHGGLAPRFPYLTPYPSSINSLGESLLRKLQARPQPPPHPPNPYPGLPRTATTAEQYLYSGDGPLWYRGWALEDEEKACSEVDDVLERTGTRRLIMGHTPTFTNIVSRCDGKVIIIDTGISHAYNGVLSGLSITYSLHKLPKSNAKHERWLETEEVAAVYENETRILVKETRTLVGGYGVVGM